MKQLEFHQEAHVAVMTLGDLSLHSDVHLMKQLGAVKQEGIASLKAAQVGFEGDVSRLSKL